MLAVEKVVRCRMLAVAVVVGLGLPVDVDDVVAPELHLVARVQPRDADRLVAELANDMALLDGDDLDPHAFAPVASAP